MKTRPILLLSLIFSILWHLPPCRCETPAYAAFAGVRVYVSGAATGAQTGESWANAIHEISDGVALAAAAGVREVWVAQGTYAKPLALLGGVEVYGGFAGGETQRSARNPRLHPVILDVSRAAGGAPAAHAVTITSATDARLDGLTITGGRAAAPGDDSGGGIYCADLPDASIWIVGCTVRDNTATGAGGGIGATSTTAPRLVGCILTRNTAARGGALAAQGLGTSVNDCTISLNTATVRGGGVWGGAPGVVLRNCVISTNTAPLGGGVAAEGALELRACRLAGNQSGASGGGVAALEGALLRADRCAFVANTAAAAGGAIHYAGLDESQGGLLTGCTFAGNRAALGGALAAAAPLGVRGCLLAANTATSGGAVALLAGGVALIGDTISDNAALAGGGVYGAGGAGGALTGCLLTGNGGGAVHAASCTNGGLGLRHCLLSGNTPGDLCDGTARLSGAAAINALGTWNCGNGEGAPGLSADYHLLAGSAALGMGALAGIMESDIDGEERPGADGKVDAGSDETSGTLGGPPTHDTQPPLSWVLPQPAAQTAAVFTLNVYATDDLSGMVGVRLYYRLNNGPWQPGSYFVVEAGVTVPLDFDSSKAGGDGRYDFYTVAMDAAGNTEAPPAAPDATTQVTVPFSDACVYVDAQSTGSQSGDTWNDALHSIGEAIECAVAQDLHVIRVAGGVYVENITLADGLALLGGYTRQGNGTWARDPAGHPTVICGIRTYYNLDLQPAVVTLEGVRNVRLDGLAITGGYCAAGAGLLIRASDASNLVSNCAITGNQAPYAAGVLCDGGSQAVLSGCRISGNAAGQQGGGLAIDQNAGPRLVNCIISGNTAGVSGGGVYAANLSAPVLIHCTLEGNMAPSGSALACAALANPPAGATPPLRLLSSLLTGNRGVAVAELDAGSEPAVEGCLLDANTGGDYLNEGSAVLTGAAAIDSRAGASGKNYDGPAALLAAGQGQWTAAAVYNAATHCTLLVDAAAAFTPGSLAGRLINPEAAQPLEGLIVANTATTLQVLGDLSGVARQNGAYRILDPRPGDGSAALDRVATTSTAGLDLDGRARPLDLPGVGNDGTDATADIGACEARPWLAVIDAASGAELAGGAVLDFGSWDPGAGQPPQRTLLLVNRGSTSLHFSLPGAALGGTGGADFTIDAGFATTPLAAGASRALIIRFYPSAAGPRQGVLSLETDDPDTPSREVTLMGMGLAQALAIMQQPAAQTVSAGRRAVFSVGAVGSGPLGYRWQKDGAGLASGGRIAGAETAVLTLDGVQEADEGVYRCVVSDGHGTLNSSGAALVLWRHTLHIDPALGDPDPPAGDHVYTSGTLVTVRVATPVLADTTGTTRLVCRGWQGTGAARGDPAATQLTFVLDAPATVLWQWKRQYYLSAAADDPARGSVIATEGGVLAGWVDEGSSVTLQAAAQPGFRFNDWGGGLAGRHNPIRFGMRRPIAAVARFLDSSLPAATDLALDGAGTTSAGLVRYLVSFSTDVSGVSAGDFAIRTTPGLAGVQINTLTGSGAQYAVTLATGSGDGEIYLDLIDRDTITDGKGTPLGGAGLANGDYISVDPCTIDRTPPQATLQPLFSSPANQTELSFRLHLSEPAATDLTADDVELTGTLAAGAGKSIAGGGMDYTITLRPADPEAQGTLGLRPGAWVRDRAGNRLGAVAWVLGTIRHQGVLAIQPLPAAAAWTLSGPAGLVIINYGPATLRQAGTGSYTIVWAPLAGWVTPPAQTLTLARNQVTTLTGRYRDVTPPAGSFTIADGASATVTPRVTLALAATDAASGVRRMRLGNDAEDWGAWEDYAPLKAWTLSAGDGLKTVRVQFEDAEGNDSAPLAQTITLDTTPPDFTDVQAWPETANPGTTVTLTMTATEALAGSPTLTINGRSAALAGHEGLDYEFNYLVSGEDDEGDATLEITGPDAAGNLGDSGYAYRLIIDKTAPASAIRSPSGKVETNSVLNITWTADDPAPPGDVASGVQWIFIYWRLNGRDYSVVGPFDAASGSTDFDTTPYGSGNYCFYSVAVDAAGNVENKSGGTPDCSASVGPSAARDWRGYE